MMTAGPTENALVAPTANAFRSTQRQPLLLDVAVRRDPAIVDPTRVFDVAALLEVRIEDRVAGRAAELQVCGYLGAVETAITRRPRTDPGERNYRTGLPPRVMTSNRQSGQGCRSFGLGSQHSTIRIIRRHATLLEVRIEGPVPACLPYFGESAVSHKFIR